MLMDVQICQILQINNQEKSKYPLNKVLYLYLYSTLNQKYSVDEVAPFLDGGKLPCILIENKVGLVYKKFNLTIFY